MRNLLRSPLTWLVLAEFVVVGVLIVLAWNAVAGLAKPVLASPSLQLPGSTSASDSPLPDLPAVSKPSTGPLPGLNLEGPFWRSRLAQLNQEQVYFEQLEWHVVHSALEAAQRYLLGVVLPAVQHAEAGR